MSRERTVVVSRRIVVSGCLVDALLARLGGARLHSHAPTLNESGPRAGVMLETMIILAATPIGNLGDASARLRDALEAATVIASEDTRVTQRLLAGLGIANRPKLIALHDHNEREKAADLVELARETDLLVLSDAGMPTVSDPGFPLVAAAADAGVEVTVLPGPSAVITALAVSGLPTDRFGFEGFLPRKPGERSRRLAELVEERRTLVFFEWPIDSPRASAALAEVFGDDRRRRLPRAHQDVRGGARGPPAELADVGRGRGARRDRDRSRRRRRAGGEPRERARASARARGIRNPVEGRGSPRRRGRAA